MRSLRQRLAAPAVLAGLIILMAAAAVLPADRYTVNQTLGKSLTDYLHKHRLPAVGAQILDYRDGNRQVVLFGFVATAFGKTDAEAKSRTFLNQSDVLIENRIEVRPELRNPSPAPSPDAEDQPPKSAADLLNEIERSPQHDAPEEPDPFASDPLGP